jgi:hypothetical protein
MSKPWETSVAGASCLGRAGARVAGAGAGAVVGAGAGLGAVVGAGAGLGAAVAAGAVALSAVLLRGAGLGAAARRRLTDAAAGPAGSAATVASRGGGPSGLPGVAAGDGDAVVAPEPATEIAKAIANAAIRMAANRRAVMSGTARGACCRSRCIRPCGVAAPRGG